MALKQATIDNLYEIQKICIDAYSLNFYNHWEPGGLEWYLEKEFGIERLTNDLIDKNTKYFFIIDNNKSIGFIKIRNISHNEYLSENALALEKIYILPSSKGNGIGKIAINELIEIAKKDKKEYIFLGVIDTNLPAIQFYEKIGFRYHSKTRLDIPYFKEHLKGMNKMCLHLKD